MFHYYLVYRKFLIVKVFLSLLINWMHKSITFCNILCLYLKQLKAKGIVHPKMKMWCSSAYPKGIQDVGDFVSSVEHKRRYLTQTVAVCQTYNGHQWDWRLWEKKMHTQTKIIKPCGSCRYRFCLCMFFFSFSKPWVPLTVIKWLTDCNGLSEKS